MASSKSTGDKDKIVTQEDDVDQDDDDSSDDDDDSDTPQDADKEDADDDDDDDDDDGMFFDEGPLPKMTHQTLKYGTAAGFHEIYPRTTKPIYSKMDLKKLVGKNRDADIDTLIPPTDPSFMTREAEEEEEEEDVEGRKARWAALKTQQFEKIYGKVRTVERERMRQAEKDARQITEDINEVLESAEFMTSVVELRLYRLVLVGSHKEEEEDFDHLIEWTKDVVDDINKMSSEPPLTGVFLVYPSHYLHVLEGPEDGLTNLMRKLADQFEATGYGWKLEYHPGKGITARDQIFFKTVKTAVIGLFPIPERVMDNGWKGEKAEGDLSMTQKDVPRGKFRERLFKFTKQAIISTIALNKLPTLKPPPPPPSPTSSSSSKHKHKSQHHHHHHHHHSHHGHHPHHKSKSEADLAKKIYEELKQEREDVISTIIPKPPMMTYVMQKNAKRKIQLRSLREHLDYFWKIPPVILTHQTDWPVPSKIAYYD